MPKALPEQLDAALAAARAAPLSAKKAMLAALLLDAEIDRRFALAGSGGDRDILAFRAEFASRSAALRLIMGLAALRPDGPRLVTEAVRVPIADYPTLGTADFMVSLYNDHTVQRVLIVMPDGKRHDVHAVLAEAAAALNLAATARTC